MFRPPMNEIVEVMTPTGEVDRFGRNVTETTVTSARVAHIHRTIETNDGQRRDATAEIDLPPEMPVGFGYSIKYVDQVGNDTTGAILRVNSSNDIANHVLWWTVEVG